MCELRANLAQLTEKCGGLEQANQAALAASTAPLLRDLSLRHLELMGSVRPFLGPEYISKLDLSKVADLYGGNTGAEHSSLSRRQQKAVAPHHHEQEVEEEEELNEEPADERDLAEGLAEPQVTEIAHEGGLEPEVQIGEVIELGPPVLSRRPRVSRGSGPVLREGMEAPPQQPRPQDGWPQPSPARSQQSPGGDRNDFADPVVSPAVLYVPEGSSSSSAASPCIGTNADYIRNRALALATSLSSSIGSLLGGPRDGFAARPLQTIEEAQDMLRNAADTSCGEDGVPGLDPSESGPQAQPAAYSDAPYGTAMAPLSFSTGLGVEGLPGVMHSDPMASRTSGSYDAFLGRVGPPVWWTPSSMPYAAGPFGPPEVPNLLPPMAPPWAAPWAPSPGPLVAPPPALSVPAAPLWYLPPPMVASTTPPGLLA